MTPEELYGRAWKALAAKEGHMKRLPNETLGGAAIRRNRYVDDVRRLYCVEKMTKKDIAEHLGISKAYVTRITQEHRMTA